jgi:excisionase family DNA binding protein
MNTDDTRLLSIGEACQVLGITPQTLRRWEREGKIQCVRTDGGQRRIPKEEAARIIGCPPEEIEPPLKIPFDLKKKKMEVESIRLDFKKEKAKKALSSMKGNAVRKAREELEILKIQQEKEKVLEDKNRAEDEWKARERRKACVDAWVGYSYKCLDPVPHIFPNLMTEPESLPLELKVKTRMAVEDFLENLEMTEDFDAVRLQIESIAQSFWNDYFPPETDEQDQE